MAGFGFGNFVKPQATSVRPGDLPTFKDLSMQEKLMMLGSALRGDMQGAQQIPMLAAARARQAQQAGLDQEFSRYLTGEGVPTLSRTERPAIRAAPELPQDAATQAAASITANLGGGDGIPMKRDRVNVDIPQFSVDPGARRQGPPTLRDALPLLMKRRQAGMDIKTDIDLLDKAGPDYEYINGVRTDKRDPKGPGFIPSFDKGQEPLYDGSGRIVAIRNMDGSVQSAADMAGAVTGAQEKAKAQFDIVSLNMPDGSSVQVPRDVAVQGLLQSMSGGDGGGLGRSQTPDAASRAKIKGDAQANAQVTLPTDVNAVDTAIETATALRNHPALDMRTGGWSLLPAVPGTPGAAFEAYKQQVLGQGFLSARQALKGGGQITDYEGGKAEQAIIRAKAAQTPEDFKAAIDDYVAALERSRTILQEKAGSPRQGGAAPVRPRADLKAIPLDDRLAEARRRGLIP